MNFKIGDFVEIPYKENINSLVEYDSDEPDLHNPYIDPGGKTI